jgi:hypothetical protein
MSLSRRQFFRRFWNPGEKTDVERSVRRETLRAYVRTHLLPYDFPLSAAQEAELFADVQRTLEQASDEELFSVLIRYRLEELVEDKIHPWREEDRLQQQSERIKEVRASAPDYVEHFLKLQATPAAIEQLKKRFGLEDTKELEFELKKRIEAWIAAVEEEEILQYDVFTVKDLVFAQLRSWC